MKTIKIVRSKKFNGWSDCADGEIQHSFTMDRVLDNISVYWITGTINSSTRLYYEVLGPSGNPSRSRVTVPVGHAVYPAEIYKVRPPKAGSVLEVLEILPMNIRGQGIAWDRSQPGMIYGIIRATAKEKAAGGDHKVTVFRFKEK